MTDFYVLLIDGSCIKISAINRKEALNKLYNYICIDEPFDEFIENINLIEWKDDTGTHLFNYSTGSHKITSNSTYELEKYSKPIKLTGKPTKQLSEEFDYYEN